MLMFRDELKGKVNKGEKCNPDINIEQHWGKGDGESNQSNPHWTQDRTLQMKEISWTEWWSMIIIHRMRRQWNDDYKLDLIGREYCRDSSNWLRLKKSLQFLMTWQHCKKQTLIQCHTKNGLETILESSE